MTTNQAQRTPGPAEIAAFVASVAPGAMTAEQLAERQASLIRACNAHDDLVTASGILRCLISSPRFQAMTVADAIAELAVNGMDARAALAKVDA